MSSSSSTLSLHVGPASHHAGMVLWNLRRSDEAACSTYNTEASVTRPSLPKCVRVDMAANYSQFELDFDPYEGQNAPPWSSGVQMVHQHRPSVRPSSLQHIPFHEKSSVRLQPADFIGHGLGMEAVECRNTSEDVLDRLRYFAEASDHVDCIDLYMDASAPFLSLCDQLLDDLAVDYGNVSLPLWVSGDFADGRQRIASRSLQWAQRCSLLTPIQTCDTVLETALALHTAMGYRSSGSMTSPVWCLTCTRGGALPVCSLEACLPGMSNQLSMGCDALVLKQFLLDAFSASPRPQSALNPFARMMSPFADSSMVYSNVLVLRGMPDDLPAQLYRHCFDSSASYLLSAAIAVPEAVRIHADMLMEEAAADRFVTIAGAAAAVGASNAAGAFIRQAACSLPTQFGAISNEERDAVAAEREDLLGMAERYEDTNIYE